MLHASSNGWFTQSDIVHADGRMASIMVMAEETFHVRPSIAQHPIPAGEVALVNLATMEHVLLTLLSCQQLGIPYPAEGVMYVAIHRTLQMSAQIVAYNAF